MDEKISLGINIRLFREAADMTQDDLCKTIGASRTTITNWETGNSSPDASLLPKIADALHVSIDELFSGAFKATKILLLNEHTDITFAEEVKNFIDRADGLSLEAAAKCSEIIADDIKKRNNISKSYDPISFPLFLSIGDSGYFEMKEKMKELRKIKRKYYYSYSDIRSRLNAIDSHYDEHICLAYLFFLFSGEKVPSQQLYERIYEIVSVPKS